MNSRIQFAYRLKTIRLRANAIFEWNKHITRGQIRGNRFRNRVGRQGSPTSSALN